MFHASAQYRFDSWTTDNGLPENSILALRQTRDGYLWMTTYGGLVRFDGARFRWFTRENTPQLITNSFNESALIEDRRGCLWAGTETGGAVRYCAGVFSSITANDGLPNNDVVRIDEDADGTIWIFTNPGLAKWRDGRLTRIAPAPGSEFNPWLNAPITNTGGDAHMFGLWRVEKDGWQRFAYGHWSPLPLPPDAPDDKTQLRIMAIMEDSQGRLWYKFRHHPSTYYCLQGATLSSFENPLSSSYFSFQDRRGFLWASDHDGRNTLVRNGSVIPVDGFSTPHHFRALEDREGILWLGTTRAGLYRATPLVTHSFQVPGSPELNDIETVLEDRVGNIWFGSHGLFRLQDGRFDGFYRDGSLGKLEAPSRTSYPQQWENIVSCLYEDRDGTLWVGTWKGAARFNGRSLVADGPISEVKDRVDAILRDRADDLWVGGERGLYRIRGDQATQLGLTGRPPGFKVQVMIESRSDTIWVGTKNGLARVRNGEFSPWNGPSDLSSANVTALYEDGAGVLWIGTYDTGLYRLEHDKVTHYTSANGLFNDSVFQILGDEGFLWCTSHLGIYRVGKQELNDFAAGKLTGITSTHFGKGDGLINVECSTQGKPNGHKGRDGRLWFPTAAGLAVIDSSALTFNRNPPPIVIEEVTLDGKPAPSRNGVKVAPGQENLEIQYTALSFIKPEQIHFRYRLDGLNEEWINAGARRTAYYSHLPPGNYTFRVIAANSDGIWNMEGATTAIRVLPPWYETWWFETVASLAVVGLIWMIWQRRIAAYKRVQAVQQAFSRQLIASQEGDRKRIAAELHDSLGQRLVVIKNLAQMQARANSSSSGFDEISAEASLALEEVREISYDLRPYQLDRLGLTKAIEAVASRAVAASEIDLSSGIDNIDDLLPKESEIHFYRVAQECLSNMVKHSQASIASIIIRRDGKWLRFRVEDDGIGFIQDQSNSDRGHGGFGLLGISERVQLLAGTSQIRSAPGKGTVIEIDIDTEALCHE
jgi:signal transduction histidine kinase/ligand-binding sensor domain-containing protein